MRAHNIMSTQHNKDFKLQTQATTTSLNQHPVRNYKKKNMLGTWVFLQWTAVVASTANGEAKTVNF